MPELTQLEKLTKERKMKEKKELEKKLRTELLEDAAVYWSQKGEQRISERLALRHRRGGR